MSLPTRVVRASWYGLAATLAVLAFGNGLDRQSRRDPDLAARVPGPFRSFAQEALVRSALASGQADQAVTEAETLVRQRPVPAESLFLLGVAEGLNGNPEGASNAIGLSAQRGWRLTPLQIMMIGASLEAGQPDGAAARLLAIWSVGADPQALAQATRQVLSAPGGAEAFGTALAKARFVQAKVLREGPAYATPAQFARVIEAAVANGATVHCRQLAGLAAAMERQGAPSEARRIKQLNCTKRD